MTMSMEQIHRIKELQRQQKGAYQIAGELGLDPKTVRKYLAQEGFSPKAPVSAERSSKLDPYKPVIDTWLQEDTLNRSQQRHTGQRVYDPEFPCSYRAVSRYVRACRERQPGNQKGFLPLQWHPGEAHSDRLRGSVQFTLQFTIDLATVVLFVTRQITSF